ncbi:hypothetical protein EYF80_036582 [Liparis tanakae]|uniref:Uncharacterized protein n=1 Tax=Liparis tanakae TaxID=230148 RepID=A0A4Z2GJ49_9TELE|nr:hypothetical protein EYF80_036582 [Liparis tanakae]
MDTTQRHEQQLAHITEVMESMSIRHERNMESLRKPYIPAVANISARLRAKILQGKYINLISLILPSPECEEKIATGEQFTALIKTADPRMSKDLSIG